MGLGRAEQGRAGGGCARQGQGRSEQGRAGQGKAQGKAEHDRAAQGRAGAAAGSGIQSFQQCPPSNHIHQATQLATGVETQASDCHTVTAGSLMLTRQRYLIHCWR